jgi:hypothetical protein
LADLSDYQEHICAFIDLLGFKEAVDNNKSGEIVEILAILVDFRKMVTKEVQRKVEQISDNRQMVSILPAISIFSDNIVLSIPVSLDGIPNIMRVLAGYISKIAALALSKGFLIRGGIAKGMLYHKDGIVFGQALIDAYKLESEVAVYPRVLVSQNIYIGSGYKFFITKDFDGLDMLNYFCYGSNIVDMIEELKRTSGLISSNAIRTRIDQLTNAGKLKEVSKWNWFLKYYTEILETDKNKS